MVEVRNKLAEEALIAAVMIEPAMFDQVRQFLAPGDFFTPAHTAIWRAFGDLRDQLHDFNPLSLWEQLGRNGARDHLRGPGDLGHLVQGMPFFSRFSSVRDYVELVLKSAISREMMRICDFTTSQLADGGRDEYEILESVQSRYKLLQQRRLENDWTTAHTSLKTALSELELLGAGARPDVVSTGFRAVDDLLINHGLTAGQYFILAARTSRGKSTMALQMAVSALRADPQKVCAYFTVEMTAVELMKRLLALHARIPYSEFRRGFFTKEQGRELLLLEEESRRWQFPIVHKGGLTPATIFAEATRIKQEYGRLDLIVIDHIGLLKHERRSDNRTRELGQISRDIKSGLVDLGCAGIVPAQVNREGGKRSDRLQLHDLRDSGDLEQDADLVGIINVTGEGTAYNEIALDIAKQRNGRTGVVEMRFDLSCGRFEEIGDGPKTHSEIDWTGGGPRLSILNKYKQAGAQAEAC